MGKSPAPSLPNFILQFPEADLQFWADRYKYKPGGSIESITNQVKSQGFAFRNQLLAICEWKTHRALDHVAENEEEYIKEVTQFALSTDDERCRIEALTIISGVKWPTASVILHFCHLDKYPILDVRALQSFGVDIRKVKVNYEFWWKYVETCRELSARRDLDMRTIDKAMWQYSKENFKTSSGKKQLQ